MPRQEQSEADISQLLDDIKFIQRTSKIESQRINNRIRSKVGEANLPADIADSIISEVSNELGQLRTRVKMAEKTLHSLEKSQHEKTPRPSGKKLVEASGTTVEFDANQIAHNENLLPIETSADGVSYCWSGSDPEIRFEFSLNRRKPIGMRIIVYSLIKPEFSKQLKLFIDGEHIAHRFKAENGLFAISCTLPRSASKCKTAIRIVLPATHSPKELGTSNDFRKLGIAITKFQFGEPESGLRFMLKRLRLLS